MLEEIEIYVAGTTYAVSIVVYWLTLWVASADNRWVYIMFNMFALMTEIGMYIVRYHSTTVLNKERASLARIIIHMLVSVAGVIALLLSTTVAQTAYHNMTVALSVLHTLVQIAIYELSRM